MNQKIKQGQVAPHGPLHSMRFDGIEGTQQAEKLEGILADPIPGSHFECDGEEVLVRADP